MLEAHALGDGLVRGHGGAAFRRTDGSGATARVSLGGTLTKISRPKKSSAQHGRPIEKPTHKRQYTFERARPSARDLPARDGGRIIASLSTKHRQPG